MTTPHPSSDTISVNRPIGLFDSGVGGLTVLENLVRVLPEEAYVYFGDTLHMPYGSKTFDEIRVLVEGILAWLCQEQQVKLVVVACNTSAGVLYPILDSLCPVPLIEPITPVCQWLAEEGEYRKVGVIATPTTVLSGRYASVLTGLNPAISVLQQPCDGLARMIESGEGDTVACRQLLETYLTPLVQWGAEAIILGCTHYPHVRHVVEAVVPSSVTILDPADFMSQKVYQLLGDGQGLRLGGRLPGDLTVHVSDGPELFKATSGQLPLRNLTLKDVPTLTVVTTKGRLGEATPHTQT